MNKKDLYLLYAADCQQMACITRNEHERLTWLDMAQSWLQLAQSAFYSVAVSVRSVPPQCGVARLFLRGIFGRPVVEVRRNCGAKLLDWIRVRLPTPSLHAVPVVAYH